MQTILISILVLVSFNQKSEEILFMGDSMTTYKGGWQHQLSRKLGTQYMNLAVGGKRTLWMLQKLQEHLKIKSSYKTCFIYGGINDGFSYVKLESALQNMQSMVDLCNTYGIKPVVILGYCPDSVMINLRPSIQKGDWHRERYGRIQELFRTGLKNCQIIPIDESINRFDTDDGIHFTASGHRKLSAWVYQNFKKP